jgi:hypothetical protein
LHGSAVDFDLKPGLSGHIARTNLVAHMVTGWARLTKTAIIAALTLAMATEVSAQPRLQQNGRRPLNTPDDIRRYREEQQEALLQSVLTLTQWF